jgi:hypothetical protein
MVAVGAEGLLYDPVARRAQRLNTEACLVWQCCDGTAGAGEIADELADAFGRPREVVAAQVDDLLEELWSKGLLVGGAPVGSAADPPPARLPAEASLPDGDPPRRLGPYVALDVGVTVDCHDDGALADELERSLAPLSRGGGPEVPAIDPATDTVIVVWGDGDGGWHLDVAGVRLHAPGPGIAADYLLWQVTRLAIDRSSRYLCVHSAAVARDGVAVAIVGEANSGKSTLATLLVAAGCGYLSDEVAAIDLDTGDLVAFPKPISLDPGTQRLLPYLDPGVDAGGSTRWRGDPGSVRPGAVARRARLAHLVFPRHVPGADNAPTAVELPEAVEAIVAGAFNLEHHADRLDDLVALVERCSRHGLRHDGLDGPVAAVLGLLDPTGSEVPSVRSGHGSD